MSSRITGGKDEVEEKWMRENASEGRRRAAGV